MRLTGILKHDLTLLTHVYCPFVLVKMNVSETHVPAYLSNYLNLLFLFTFFFYFREYNFNLKRRMLKNVWNFIYTIFL